MTGGGQRVLSLVEERPLADAGRFASVGQLPSGLVNTVIAAIAGPSSNVVERAASQPVEPLSATA